MTRHREGVLIDKAGRLGGRGAPGHAAAAVRERVTGMQRTRRLASIAVIAMVGVAALSGCRSEPGVAAYLGDREITEDQITEVVDDVKRKLAPSPTPGGASPSPEEELPPGVPQPTVPGRADVLGVLLLEALCGKLSAERGYQAQEQIAPEQVAGLVSAPADSLHARNAAKLYTCLFSIPVDQSVTPTKEDLADLVARARTAPGVVPPDTPDEAVADRLSGPEYLRALSHKRLLEQTAADQDVTVNPRYRPLEFPVLSFRGNIAAVSVSLSEPGPGTVVDPR